jgi:hypothetical protein
MMGAKRQHKLMEEEDYEYSQDVINEENLDDKSEESKHEHPRKRQKTAGVFPSNTISSVSTDSIFTVPKFDAHPLDA